MAMYSGPHVIFLKANKNLCLGVKKSVNPPTLPLTLEVQTFDKSRFDQSWQLVPIPTNFDDTAYFLMHLDTRLCPHFGQDGSVPIEALDPSNKEYLIRLEVVRDGYVGINNHDRKWGMAAKGDTPEPGTAVIVWRAARTINEQWIFVSTVLYDQLPQ